MADTTKASKGSATDVACEAPVFATLTSRQRRLAVTPLVAVAAQSAQVEAVAVDDCRTAASS